MLTVCRLAIDGLAVDGLAGRDDSLSRNSWCGDGHEDVEYFTGSHALWHHNLHRLTGCRVIDRNSAPRH